MAETQKKRSPVFIAVLLFVVAAAALAAAFYYFDGMTLVSDLTGLDLFAIGSGRVEGPGKPGTSTVEPTSTALALPAGVSREFALRLWQEQVDSQANLRMLVDGDITELRFGVPDYSNGYSGTIPVTVAYKDGTSAPGELKMEKHGANWYISGVRGMRESVTGGMADTVGGGATSTPTPLPAVEDVDVGVVNTMFAEQSDSQDVFDDYLKGNVEKVVIRQVKRGPGTATILATMHEKQHKADAELVAVTKTVDGKELWFLVKFAKLAEVPN